MREKGRTGGVHSNRECVFFQVISTVVSAISSSVATWRRKVSDHVTAYSGWWQSHDYDLIIM